MPLIRFTALAALALAVASCAVDTGYNRYQQPSGQHQAGQGAVTELQRNARDARDRGDYLQAIEYLQRAIKIEPRNPHSWHYLAETYRQSGDDRRCIEMVERSFSYSNVDDDLDQVNQTLRQKCGQGYAG